MIEGHLMSSEVLGAAIGQEGRSYLEKLTGLLSGDLDFHDQDSSYASHNFHSFPAKFPPQLPRKFIRSLTVPGDVVLDPMIGSGTTLVEAFLLGRCGVGFDIDPLALLLAQTKVTSLDSGQIAQLGKRIVTRAKLAVAQNRNELEKELAERWDSKTRDFVAYWFAQDTQVALHALLKEIEQISDEPIRAFFELAFSAIIITKSGGVSLALDLAHTRPHRARVVADQSGRIIMGSDQVSNPSRRVEFSTKKLGSPFDAFEKRVAQNLKGLPKRGSDRMQPYLEGLVEPEPDRIAPYIALGDAQSLSLDDHSVDLIVTSPPYASNAIDYMRAHKFSLVWFGYSIDDLGEKRKGYIGGETTTDFVFEELPDYTTRIVTDLAAQDEKKGRVLHRYYSEMARVLREMFRVLKPGTSAIVVVGSSVMRGRDTETQTCLAEIGQTIGFQVPKIGVRHLDRNRRMMPAGMTLDLDSQIQQRMHEEYVIGFYKPQV
jgi:DNA modification methylase